MPKNYLFILSQPPHSGIATQEILDLILTTAAFDQQVSVLFMDMGVWQLKHKQVHTTGQYKDTLAMFNALELYDIDNLYVEHESLLAQGLSPDDLALPVQVVLREELHNLWQQFAIIV